METKWYSDIWALVIAPFKRGIPQIVEQGSCHKGFIATLMTFLLYIFCSQIIPLICDAFLGVPLSEVGSELGTVVGQGLFSITLGIVLLYFILALYSVIFSWIAGKFNIETTYETVLTVCWYEMAYGQILKSVLAIWQTIFLLLCIVLNLSNYVRYIGLVVLAYSLYAVILWCFWVSVSLLSRQINISRLTALGIAILAFLILVAIIWGAGFLLLKGIHA
ncbi:hypothetical protein [Veillonella sp. AS16]|uniref:hypothetical protein n=1 Tax=Veillonella sp. AS16 TaxID=936589 RepID=UPI0003E24057|nr:hypothetical protein [Veillonella sp. AS16]ETS92795.1 hypothetical protein HMPREF1521_1309 [Veillonella sp. AS16]